MGRIELMAEEFRSLAADRALFVRQCPCRDEQRDDGRQIGTALDQSAMSVITPVTRWTADSAELSWL
jgi:hypothetical protein